MQNSLLTASKRISSVLGHRSVACDALKTVGLVSSVPRCAVASSRWYGSSHGPKKPTIHPEEYLEIARNWPHEYHHPDNYKLGGADEQFTPANVGHRSDHPDGSETVDGSRHESFSNPFWGKVVFWGGLVGLAAAANSYYTEGMEEHPLTTWLRTLHMDLDANREINKEWLKIFQREADDRMIQKEWNPPKIRRLSTTHMFERASDHLIAPGSQADTSNIKFKTTWAEDDDLFGPPYPNKSE